MCPWLEQKKTFAADDFKKLFYEAQGLMYNESYEFALPILLKLDSMQADNANILYQIGMCYYFSALESEKISTLFGESG